MTSSRGVRSQGHVKLSCVALGLLAAFWALVALFLIFAPENVLSASLAARRYGAAGCLIFAASCQLARAA
jgi:hypothetical protein